MPASKLLIDRSKRASGRAATAISVNAEGWYGGDIDKLWLKTEIEGEYGARPSRPSSRPCGATRSIPGSICRPACARCPPRYARGHLVLGVEGLAPYWIEVDAAAFLSDKGDITARVEAEHDISVTQKLILQPRVEFDFAAQDIPG